MAKKAKKAAKTRPVPSVRRRKVRMSKTEMRTATVMQDYAHVASSDIASRRAMLDYQQQLRDVKIASLKSDLATLNRETVETEAELRGLGAVIARRGSSVCD